MRDITVEIDVTCMNVHLIKLMRLYELSELLHEPQSMTENYIYLTLLKAGVPVIVDSSGEFKVVYGTLEIGVNVVSGINNPLYVWKDAGNDEGEAA